MTQMIGRCADCGKATVVKVPFEFDLSTAVGFSGVTVKRSCPSCGGAVRIGDGRFTFKGDVVELLRAPGWTYDALRDLRVELQWAFQKFPSDPEGVVERIEAVSPEVGSLVRRAMTDELFQPVMALLGVLIAAIGLVLAGMTYGLSARQDPTLEQRVDEEVARVLSQLPAADNASGLRDSGPQPHAGDDVDRDSDTDGR